MDSTEKAGEESELSIEGRIRKEKEYTEKRVEEVDRRKIIIEAMSDSLIGLLRYTEKCGMKIRDINYVNDTWYFYENYPAIELRKGKNKEYYVFPVNHLRQSLQGDSLYFYDPTNYLRQISKKWVLGQPIIEKEKMRILYSKFEGREKEVNYNLEMMSFDFKTGNPTGSDELKEDIRAIMRINSDLKIID